MNKEQSIKQLDKELSTLLYDAEILKKFIHMAITNGIDKNAIQILLGYNQGKSYLELEYSCHIFFNNSQPYLYFAICHNIFLFKVIDKYITDLFIPGIDYSDYEHNAFNTKRVTDEYIILLCNMIESDSYDDTEILLIDRFTMKVLYCSLPFFGVYRILPASEYYFPETKQLFTNHNYAKDISFNDLKDIQIYNIIYPETLLFDFLGA